MITSTSIGRNDRDVATVRRAAPGSAHSAGQRARHPDTERHRDVAGVRRAAFRGDPRRGEVGRETTTHLPVPVCPSVPPEPRVTAEGGIPADTACRAGKVLREGKITLEGCGRAGSSSRVIAERSEPDRRIPLATIRREDLHDIHKVSLDRRGREEGMAAYAVGRARDGDNACCHYVRWLPQLR